jgi:tryptophan halogenase
LDISKKFVILGGGTAGWLTALYIRQSFPNSSVTVVASSEIGILGAGEGTTPHFIQLIDELKIDLKELMAASKGTFKTGIKFTNWNGDGTHFFHPFRHFFTKPTNIQNLIDENYPFLSLDSISRQDNLDQFIPHASMAYNMRVGKKVLDDDHESCEYSNRNHVALHFDANLLAKFLQSKGLERNITLHDKIVKNFKTDSDSYITDLVFDDDTSLACDFLFDCSGFKRFAISGLYNSPWQDYSPTLPVNKAVPFFIQNPDGEIPSYTEAIAMKYGWSWKIPVHNRFGCGYVFDSSYITVEQAIEEIHETFGRDIVIPRSFSFNAGTFKQPWIKNCCAIGLASGFIEPLEATSIWVAITSMRTFVKYRNGFINKDQKSIDNFNDYIVKMNNDILDFLYFHYDTKRTDTEFWKNFTDKNKLTDSLESIYTQNKEILPPDAITRFGKYSWLAVGSGIKWFDAERAKQKYLSLNKGMKQPLVKSLYKENSKAMAKVNENSSRHRELLESKIAYK